MLTLNRITHSDDPLFNRLMSLYTEAFPPDERREISLLGKMLADEPAMYFNAIYCDDELAGLFVYWELGCFYYLEHLAVFPEMRNKKIGQQVLDWMAIHLKGLRLLEAEPAEEEMAVRRVRYYERNGYHVLDKDYIQPAYDASKESCHLWIMGNQTAVPDLKEHIRTIAERVYGRK